MSQIIKYFLKLKVKNLILLWYNIMLSLLHYTKGKI